MKLVVSTVIAGAVAVMAVSANLSAQAQAPAQTPQQPRPAAQAAQPPSQQVTITGCIQSEADYRRATNAGRGGAAGTGVGAANEFVLVNASMAGSAAAPAAPPAVGTAGSANANAAFELSGTGEGQAAKFVGKRVEIVGMLKPAEAGAAGPTGGATVGDDLRLREIDVTSVREATGACTPAPAPSN